MQRIEKSKNLTKDTLLEDYKNLKTLTAVAKKYNTDRHVIAKCFDRLGIDYVKDNRIYTLNQDFFKNIDDPNVLYWIGFLLADGCVFKNTIIKLNLNEKDVEQLKKFKIDVGSNKNIGRTINKLSEQNVNWHNVNI